MPSKKVVYPCLLFLLLLLPLIFLPKGQILLYINRFHAPFPNMLFTKLSSIGNGITILIIALVLLLLFRFRYVYEFSIAFAFHMLFVHLFKQFIFPESFRPIKYYNYNETGILNLVEGVKLYGFGTFPSGHTTTIFFIAIFIALILNNKIASFSLFLLALAVGISRIYLVQHFYVDVYAGILFGTTSAFVAHWLVSINPKKWYGKRLLKLRPISVKGRTAKDRKSTARA